MMKKLFLCLAAVMLLFLAQAAAEEITVLDVTTRIGDYAVSYPQLSGMADEAVQQKINDDIVLSADVTNHLVTLATLGSTQQKLNVSYEVCLLNDDVFSTVISARGKLPGKRDGHRWTALSYHLETGERIVLEDLFSDVEAAVEWMEAAAEASLSEEWNGYMEYSDILPLPREQFTLDAKGITFWYPGEQFSLLSGYSGAVQFWYEELEGLWLTEPASDMTDDELRAVIAQYVEEGRLPKVPVAMGRNMQEVADTYRLLRTPDEFPGGRYFVLEDPQFRQVLVISDSLNTDYSQSVVEGLQLKRGGLFGLMIGKCPQERWREVLGEPEDTVAVTENMAYDYNLPVGEYDVYHFGENELRMHADENGLLCAVQLCK